MKRTVSERKTETIQYNNEPADCAAVTKKALPQDVAATLRAYGWVGDTPTVVASLELYERGAHGGGRRQREFEFDLAGLHLLKGMIDGMVADAERLSAEKIS